MTRVVKFEDYKKSQDFLEEFVERLINQSVKESKEESAITKIANQLQKDIKFNYSLIFTFGAGINAMYPIVMHLLKNSNLNVELTTENVVLLTITAIAIAYLEEKKNKTGDLSIVCDICNSKGLIQTEVDEETCHKCSGKGSTQSLVTRNDTDTLLAELKLRGIGNGIVKKLVACFVSIGGFLKMVFKHASLIISNFVDLFAYTSLLIPTMNAISGIINASNLTLETLPMDIAKNLLVFGVGVSTMLAKRGYEWISKKIGDFLRTKNLIKGNEPTELRGIESQIKKDEIINEQ
jgi:hypothetical protein